MAEAWRYVEAKDSDWDTIFRRERGEANQQEEGKWPDWAWGKVLVRHSDPDSLWILQGEQAAGEEEKWTNLQIWLAELDHRQIEQGLIGYRVVKAEESGRADCPGNIVRMVQKQKPAWSEEQKTWLSEASKQSRKVHEEWAEGQTLVFGETFVAEKALGIPPLFAEKKVRTIKLYRGRGGWRGHSAAGMGECLLKEIRKPEHDWRLAGEEELAIFAAWDQIRTQTEYLAYAEKPSGSKERARGLEAAQAIESELEWRDELVGRHGWGVMEMDTGTRAQLKGARERVIVIKAGLTVDDQLKWEEMAQEKKDQRMRQEIAKELRTHTEADALALAKWGVERYQQSEVKPEVLDWITFGKRVSPYLSVLEHEGKGAKQAEARSSLNAVREISYELLEMEPKARTEDIEEPAGDYDSI